MNLLNFGEFVEQENNLENASNCSFQADEVYSIKRPHDHLGTGAPYFYF
ncbi:hypothetical protein ABE096_14365 [Robertmurraya massiliosenegalensis]